MIWFDRIESYGAHGGPNGSLTNDWYTGNTRLAQTGCHEIGQAVIRVKLGSGGP